MLAQRQITTIPAGLPVPADTQVEMRLHLDNSLVATTGTDAEGWFTFLMYGNPGPHYFVADYDDEVHVSSSRGTGVAGVVDLANLPLFIRSFQSGYINGVLDNLAVTAAGTSMQVVVGAGAGYYRGILYDQHEPVSFTIDAPDAQNRIDRLVVEVVPQGGGATIEGRSRVRLKKGTPSTTPVAPGLTQTSTLWEEPLADILVDTGVSAIASNKVTDRRTRMGPILAPGSVTKPMLENIATPGVRVQQSSTVIAEHARTLEFPALDFTVVKGAGVDYATDALPYVSVTLNRAGLLAWLQQELDLDAEAPPENPTYTVRSADKNFDASGSWSGGWGAIPGASVQITLPAGAWLIESILNMTVRGTGSGAQFTVRLSGNATPQGSEQSMRIFASSTYRQIILSGRRNVSHSGNATYTATVERTHQSGPVTDFRDGVIYIKAYKV
jgi:hypothetical protein